MMVISFFFWLQLTHDFFLFQFCLCYILTHTHTFTISFLRCCYKTPAFRNYLVKSTFFQLNNNFLFFTLPFTIKSNRTGYLTGMHQQRCNELLFTLCFFFFLLLLLFFYYFVAFAVFFLLRVFFISFFSSHLKKIKYKKQEFKRLM